MFFKQKKKSCPKDSNVSFEHHPLFHQTNTLPPSIHDWPLINLNKFLSLYFNLHSKTFSMIQKCFFSQLCICEICICFPHTKIECCSSSCFIIKIVGLSRPFLLNTHSLYSVFFLSFFYYDDDFAYNFSVFSVFHGIENNMKLNKTAKKNWLNNHSSLISLIC